MSDPIVVFATICSFASICALSWALKVTNDRITDLRREMLTRRPWGRR